MVSSTPEMLQGGVTREQIVPSRKRIKLPAWLEIAKPRLIPLLLATTLGGMALSEGWPLPSLRLACTLGGGALAAAAAGVLNCIWEQDLDGRMQRTSGRALPSGRLSPTAAFIGAISCTLAAAALLVSGVNCLAAGLSLLGLCSYVLLYTAILKPRTPQNIVIGGVAGAIPPLVGAAAASGHVGLSGWWLFSLVMLWTPAHFWALALLLRDDYRAVGIPMLPVIQGPVVTVRAISRYGWATVLLSGFGVWALPEGGLLYGLLLIPFNARLLQMVHQLGAAPENVDRAKGLFRWSIFYMFGICLLLVVSRLPMAANFDLQAWSLLQQMASSGQFI
ncbi:putative protoheme IX farnesyltransferase [Prochlorococcus marinus str. MIT 9313]|uniref:Protoheme IX farnesyltransferase n=1 Tax=Prochlorococcus marinus (strain MIT 9313) TaxID=74547 RepID=COXX_PROMM|nr:heme o synthase [Prochlorococcus marinus]Q7V638.1 RecName: Full=Protoheme IX farnesyltransferase; AltName: Full=Heme B farnesyltransferase; AltName: Full=Heme O synthase [Prochlorococcus marinus str. MIT 9313]CAE21514.1 putative protoheme IX farnesyltransferase [Prochlorococcus marinus str. MIT 9313]